MLLVTSFSSAQHVLPKRSSTLSVAHEQKIMEALDVRIFRSVVKHHVKYIHALSLNRKMKQSPFVDVDASVISSVLIQEQVDDSWMPCYGSIANSGQLVGATLLVQESYESLSVFRGVARGNF